MDEESSVSSKSECIKALGALDLRVWLSHHNKNISKRYEHHEQNERRRKELLHGLAGEQNPQKELNNLLDLSLPKLVKRNGEFLNVALSGGACNKAVNNMLQDPTMKERYNSGVNAVTLLAEQRRKIVLNALTGSGHMTEDRKTSQEKLQGFIEARNSSGENIKPISSKITTLPEIQHEKQHNHHPQHSSSNRSHNSHHTSSSQSDVSYQHKFQPQWDHYDTMRTRWGYLQPQIRKLINEDIAHAPCKSQKYMKVHNKTLIHGSVNDIDYYHTVHEKKSEKTSDVFSKSQKINEERIRKASEYYIPSPCVRY